ARRGRAGGVGPRRRVARAAARISASSGRSEAVRVEERQMASRAGIPGPKRPRILGGPRISRPRRPLGGGAVFVSGEQGIGGGTLISPKMLDRAQRGL